MNPAQEGLLLDDSRALRRREAWCILAVFAITVACFVNAIEGQFVWDDSSMVVNNENIRSATHIREVLRSGIPLSINYYRPVPVLFWMAVFAAFGLNPTAFHLANILVHAASAVLVFLLARRITPTRSPWPALAGAVMFAIHPVNSESVAWISGGVDVCATFFSLLALYAYARDGATTRRSGWQLLSAAALLLAFLSKESALAVLPAMMIWDFAFRRDRIRSPSLAIRAWAPLLSVTAVYLGLRVYALGSMAPTSSVERNSALAGPILLGRYVELLVLPARLSALHEIPVDIPLASGGGFRAAVSLAGLGVAGFVAVKRPRPNALWFSLLTLPLLPVLYSQAMGPPVGAANRFAERHLYPSTVGLAFAVTAVGAWVDATVTGRAARRALALGALVVTGTFAVMTVARNRVWRDSVTLFSDAVAKYPASPHAHMNLGVALIEKEPDRGAAEIREAVRLDRNVLVWYFAVGLQLSQGGDYATALPYFTVVAIAAPHHPQAHYYRAIALHRTGRVVEARAEYAEAVRLDPQHADARRALAQLGGSNP